MLLIVIVFQKKLGYWIKKEKKRKKTNVPLRNKKRFSKPKFYLNFSSFLKEVYEKISRRG
jgi:hypothetical protein